jgi:hypothetical protein
VSRMAGGVWKLPRSGEVEWSGKMGRKEQGLLRRRDSSTDLQPGHL